MINEVYNLVKLSNINISQNYLSELLNNHPDFPSLLSVVDSIDALGLEYEARRTTFQNLPSEKLPLLLQYDNRLSLLVNNEDLRKLKNTDPEKNLVLVGITGKKRYYKSPDLIPWYSRPSLLLSVLACSLLSLLSISIFSSLPMVYLLFLLTAFCGVAIGYLLVAKDLGIKYDSVEAFCNTSVKTNCDTLLSSPDSKLFGIKLSDATLTYFLFQILTIFLSSIYTQFAPSALALLAILSISSISIIIYSLYYQMVKIKVWCKLCVLVNVILAFQLGILFWHKDLVFIDSFSIYILPVLLLISISIVSTLAYLKQLIYAKLDLSKDLGDFAKIVNDSTVFIEQLMKQKSVETALISDDLIIGNRDAPISIIMASNLYCKPCAVKYEELSNLVRLYPDKINLVPRFLRSGPDADKKSNAANYIIQYWLTNIKGSQNQFELTETLIKSWYKFMNLDKFKTKFPINNEEFIDQSLELEKFHYQWIESTDVKKTPTLFLNAIEVPVRYRNILSKCGPLIPELADYFARRRRPSEEAVAI